MQMIMVAGIDCRFVAEPGDRPAAEGALPFRGAEGGGRPEVFVERQQGPAEGYRRTWDRAPCDREPIDGVDVCGAEVEVGIRLPVRGERAERMSGRDQPHVDPVINQEQFEQPAEPIVEAWIGEVA